MKIKNHTIHLSVRQRVILCATISAGFFVSYYVFHVESGFKGFEIAFAPLLERILFAEA